MEKGQVETRAIGETFELKVMRQYGGSLLDACKDLGFSYSHVYGVLVGKQSLPAEGGSLSALSNELGCDREELFPPRLYRKSFFGKIYDTPGYRILEKKFGLERRRKKGCKEKFLNDLCRDRGIDYCHLCNLLSGHQSLSQHSHFCDHVASEFGVNVYDLFPPHIYKETEEHRIPFGERSLHIADEDEAQQKLKNASYGASGFDEREGVSDIHEERRTFINDIFRFLPKREARILRKLYGLDGLPPRTLEQVGKEEEEGGMIKQRVLQLRNQALKMLASKFRDEAHSLLASSERDDRVFL